MINWITLLKLYKWMFFFARIFLYNRLEHLTNEKLHVSLLMLRSKIFPLKYRFVAYRAFPEKKMKNLRIVTGLYLSSFRHTLKNILPFFFLIIWPNPCRNHLGWIITVRKDKFYQFYLYDIGIIWSKVFLYCVCKSRIKITSEFRSFMFYVIGVTEFLK